MSDDHSGSWAGRRLGPYLIEAQIGRGGMGVVYRAEQTTLGRKVALKVIAPQLAQEPAFRDRFRRESRLAAAIDHPNIIPVYAAEIAGDDLLYIAMRFVEGTDLREIIRSQGRLDVRRAASIVAQVASALDAAHARDLVHRDVKPANVLIAGRPPQEHAYLTDFGLTKHTASDSALTETGQWVGTLDFVAPEQIMGEPVDGRADVYSLGCVLFEALTGQPPFPRDADVAKIYAHLHEPPPLVTDQCPELSSEFDAVIARTLAKDREDRYQSADEFRAAILNLTSSRGPAGAPSSGARRREPAVAPPRPPTSPTLRQPPDRDYSRPTRRRTPALVIAGLILLAVGAAVGIAAGSGIFSGQSDPQGTQVVAGTTAESSGTTSKNGGDRSTSTNGPGRTTPVPPAGGLEPFHTGISPKRTLPAAYCNVRSTILYCWTPIDGYTIELPSNGPSQRLRADKAGNVGRTAPGYTKLRIGENRSGNGFTCTSQSTGLTCSSDAGYSFDLPRDRGLPTCLDPQGARVTCEQ